MSRRVATAAAVTPEQPQAAKRVRTTSQNDADAVVLAERRKLAHEAARWAVDNGKGSKAAVLSGLFGTKETVTYNMIEPLMRELKSNNGKFLDDRDHHRQLLTNQERIKLAEWILRCGDGQNPKDRVKVSAKVRELLKARHASNKKRKWVAGTVRLTDQEVAAAESNEPQLSCNFFQRFYPWCRAHGISIDEGVARSQDHTRAAKMTEKTLARHFDGEFGLAAKLIDAKVMDPVTLVISDPRRLLNSDETPQPIDAPQKGSRKKVAKRKGQTVRDATVTSKDNASINMAWDSGGHLYGLQIILKLKELHSELVAKGPPGAAYFDGKVDLARKQTRSCTFSRSADGMQTQKTFIEYLEQLDAEITQHSDAAVAAGGEPILRPVVLCLDNHASRFSVEVLKACSGQEARLGIRLFTEEPNTSGFLQSLDQYNSTFHRRYNTGRDVSKTAYEGHYKRPCTSFGMVELIKVLGGDSLFGLPGMWFFGADPYDIITAWRRVGIAGNKLCPEMIDRSEFIDQPPPMAALGSPTTAPTASPLATRKRAADLAKTPEGMVSGSLESEKAKVQRLLAHAQALEAREEAQFDPVAAGLLVPDVVVRPDKPGPNGRKRLTAMHGSVTMQAVGDEAELREREAQEQAEAVLARKQQAADRKEAGVHAARERDEKFALCEVTCVCGVVPCLWVGWKRCLVCGPKKGLCKVRVCAAARRPLMLGYTPPASDVLMIRECVGEEEAAGEMGDGEEEVGEEEVGEEEESDDEGDEFERACLLALGE